MGEIIAQDEIVLEPLTQGEQGPAGPKGDTGEQGPQGIQGVKGDDGKDGEMIYAECTTAAATAAKVATIKPAVTGFSLVSGMIIFVNFTNTNSSTAATLNVNGTGAKNIQYKNAALTSTTAGYLAANRLVALQYDGTCWQICGATTDSNTYDKTKFNGAILAGAAISSGYLIVGNSQSYEHYTGQAFDITVPILYASSAISSGATGTNNYIVFPMTLNATQRHVDSTATSNLTPYKAVYIKGTLDGKTFTPFSTTNLFTQVEPSTDDGYFYFKVGVAYSTTQIYLTQDHDIFKYSEGFKTLAQIVNDTKTYLGETNENLNETSVSAEQALLFVTEEITNRIATSLIEQGYVKIQNGVITINSNVSPLAKMQITSSLLSIIYNEVPRAWISVSGNRSEFNIDEATISTLRMRNAQGRGNLGWVADEDGHLKLKAV